MIFRHGDVVIERVELAATGKPLPRDRKGHVVLAEGEATGHAHRIRSRSAELYPMPEKVENDNGARLLVIRRPVALRHEEHRKITLPPGTYRVRVKRQYNPEGGWSPVAD